MGLELTQNLEKRPIVAQDLDQLKLVHRESTIGRSVFGG